MFRKSVRRLTLGALLVVSAAALTAATGGSAGLNFVSTYSGLSHDDAGVVCNSAQAFTINERHYCLVVTTYNNLKKSGGIEVDLKMQNWDQSSLSNPKATLTWLPAAANLTFVSSDPSICSPAQAGGVTCSFPNIPGVGSASGPGATPNESSVKLFFSSASTVGEVDFKGVATAKESGNDTGGAANVETQTVDQSVDPKAGVMTYGSDSSNDATVALPGGGAELDATVPSASSVKFKGGSSPFLAQFQASQLDPTAPGVCFPGISCTGLTLTTDLSAAPSGTFSATKPILWTADVVANNTSVLAVHTYDSVPITPSPPNTLKTAGTTFAQCDGVVFDSFNSNPQSNLSLGQIYFVRNATTAAGSTSFQVSATAKGSIITVTGTSAISGSCVRIIGDQKAEKVTGCTLNPPPPPSSPAVPGICAAKIDNSTVRVYLWDSANGGIHY
jgi:hypothetical protein